MSGFREGGGGSGLAWITGGGSGIGRALALKLAERGWRVVISGRDREKLDAVVAESPAGGLVLAQPVDVTDREAVARVVESLERELGPLDLCVLNAGAYRPMEPDEVDVDLFTRMVEVNIIGTVHGLGAVLPRMRGRGSGQVLLMGSLSGYRGLPSGGAYGATKAALINLAESLHGPLRGRGVRLRVVNPGFVRTPLTDQNTFPMPFLMEPEDAAERIVRRLDGAGFEIAFPGVFAAMLKVLRCLPYRLYFLLTRRMVRR